MFAVPITTNFRFSYCLVLFNHQAVAIFRKETKQQPHHHKPSSPSMSLQPSTVGGFSFQGCWPDDVAKSILDQSVTLAMIDLDVCATACGDYSAFGAEAGNECRW